MGVEGGGCKEISRSLGCGSVFRGGKLATKSRGCSGEEHLILDDVVADVSSQLDDQAELGIQVTQQNEVPEVGPTNSGCLVSDTSSHGCLC